MVFAGSMYQVGCRLEGFSDLQSGASNKWVRWSPCRDTYEKEYSTILVSVHTGRNVAYLGLCWGSLSLETPSCTPGGVKPERSSL